MAIKKGRHKLFNKPPGKHSLSFRRKRQPITLTIKVNALFPTKSNSSFFTIRQCPGNLKFIFTRIKKTAPDGYRIVNLQQLEKHVCAITLHTAQCERARLCAVLGRPTVKLMAESKRQGLASILEVQCQGCSKLFQLQTSPKINYPGGNRRFDINVRAVWGSMVTGGGLSKLTESLGTMGIPSMSQPTFTSIEQDIGQWWCKVLREEMVVAGAEEKRLAEERNDFFTGVPAITVVCDGGWSKRSHKHSYNASGGVAIIIGQVTRKLLYIGIRNKTCYICDIAASQKKEPNEHTCFKNWEKSSQAMEADIIVEGFCKAEEEHGVRYMRLVGDGDSSVFARIQELVPVWGPHVKKLECANHVCKCLRSNLEKLVDGNPSYKGRGKLTKAVRIRLVSAVRCAVRMRSEESDRQLAQRKLEHDIRNAVHHVFGRHDNCSEFCKKSIPAGNSDVQEDEELPEEDPLDHLVQDQCDYWTQGSSLSAQEESRVASTSMCAVDSRIIQDVAVIMDRVASKSSKLLGNFTTNIAEAWMNIRAKFDGGKFYNRCSRGSWHARCYGGALRQVMGVGWSPIVWNKVTQTAPSTVFEQLYDVRAKRVESNRRLSARPVYRAKRWKRKMGSVKESASHTATLEYGPDALEAVPDITEQQLQDVMGTYFQDKVETTCQDKTRIEESTRQQSSCPAWTEERRHRITSSNFGAICTRNAHIPVTPLIKRLLYSTFQGNLYTSRGLSAEAATVEEYRMKKAQEGDPVTIQPQGLCIHPVHSYVAASTDGLVTCQKTGDQGLLEVKFLLQKKSLSLDEAVEKEKNFCLRKGKDGLRLKTNHKFYLQIQGQMNIFQKDWLDFVIRTVGPHQLHVERIFRNSDMWENDMLPKLHSFYYKCLLPELAAPRFRKHPGIREPGNWHPAATRTATRHTRSSTQPVPSTSSTPVSVRPKRRQNVQFLGRHISHRWIVDRDKGTSQWFEGIVTDLKRGRDGDLDAVYEIRYASDEDSYEVDHLVEDYFQQCVRFTDI